MIERNIDYLAFSAPSSQANFAGIEYKIIPPVAFYKVGYQAENGIRYYFGNHKNPSLAHVVLSGKTLEYLRQTGYNDQGILEFALSQDGKISRLDLAVTKYIDEWFVTVSDVTAWYACGWFAGTLADNGAKTIARLEIDGGLGIETLYMGNMEKRGKKGIFRVYDKGLEFDLAPFLITRLELEERHDNAHNTAIRMAKGEKLAACFRSRLDCNCDEFQALMDADVADISRNAAKPKTEQEEKLEKRWRWLIDTVAPSLQDAIEIEAETDATMPNLTKFLLASGLVTEMNEGAKILASKLQIVDNATK